MIIAASDIETTGLIGDDGTPGDHRIVEVYVGRYDLATRAKVDGKLWRIDPQRSIAPAAQAVHKISIEDLRGCPIWKDVAADIRSWLDAADLIVGHNWDGFDAPFIDGELIRVGLPKLTVPTFDTMIEGRWSTPTGLIPNLGALCWACDVAYDTSKAHRGDYDCEVMMESFFKGVDWGFFNIGAPATAIAA
jgi:DNA polymerase-3 subunit epsilon